MRMTFTEVQRKVRKDKCRDLQIIKWITMRRMMSDFTLHVYLFKQQFTDEETRRMEAETERQQEGCRESNLLLPDLETWIWIGVIPAV